MNILIILVLLLAPTQYEDVRGLSITDNSIVLVVDWNSTEADLEKYKSKLLKEYNISIGYDLKFDKNEDLKWIKLTVDCNDGFKDSFQAKLITKMENVGFSRVYDTRYPPEGQFAVGYMPDIYDLREQSSSQQ